MTAPLTRRLLRIKRAAEYLSVSPATLRHLIQMGELPITKIAVKGNAENVPWLVDVRDLDGYIERNKQTLYDPIMAR